MRQDKFAGLSRGVTLVDDVAVLIQFDVRLTNYVLVLFPRRQIERIWFGARLAISADALVGLLDVFRRHVVVGLELRAAAIDDANEFDDAPIDNFAVWRFDEAELVDARVTRQRRNQANVRTFRGLNRAYTAIVSRVHVAHLEPGALAAQTTRSQR